MNALKQVFQKPSTGTVVRHFVIYVVAGQLNDTHTQVSDQFDGTPHDFKRLVSFARIM